MSTNKVYLFGTCLIDNYYPEAGIDTIDLLALAGYEVIYPEAQTCCGQPPYNSGYEAQSKQVAQKTVDLFLEQNYPLIVPSASCTGMIKNHYPALFANTPIYAEKSIHLASKTFEFIDFIIDKLPYHRLTNKPKVSVALHESCSALRETDSAKSWKALLSKMPHVTVTLPNYANECCGFGGTFSIKSSAVSLAMTQDKYKNLISTESQTIISGDCGCLINLSGYAQKHKLPFPHQHIASFAKQQFDACLS